MQTLIQWFHLKKYRFLLYDSSWCKSKKNQTRLLNAYFGLEILKKLRKEILFILCRGGFRIFKKIGLFIGRPN